MARGPEWIVNRSLDALGTGFAIGSLDDGTPITEASRRNYIPMLQELHRAAHWAFARKNAQLTLLGSATGIDWNGNPVLSNGFSTAGLVEPPWQYAYAWPIDGVAARWLPWQAAQLTSSPPLMTNMGVAGVPFIGQHPARFLVSASEMFPVDVGQTIWSMLPDLSSTQGVGLVGRRIILTNVPSASLVYTRLVLDLEEWDPTFEQAMVAFMAQRLALVAVNDRKEAIALRNAQIAVVKDTLTEARARNADDSGFPQSLNRVASWIRTRRSGSAWGAEGLVGSGPGYSVCGWDACSFSDGSVF